MVLNSHRLFFFNRGITQSSCPQGTMSGYSLVALLWLFSLPYTVPSHQLQHAGVCAVAFYRVTENGETHKSYHSHLSPAMKLGACLAFRRWIGCKESWNSCWAYSSPEKALPVQERRPDLESPEPSKARWENTHPFPSASGMQQKSPLLMEAGQSLDTLGSKSLAITCVCAIVCICTHIQINK